MRASIRGGFWALILGGASVAVASIIVGPPEGTATVDAPDLAAATPVVDEPVAEVPTAPVAQATAEPVVEVPATAVEVPATPAVEAAVEPVAEAIVEPVLEAHQASANPDVTTTAEATVAPDISTSAPDLDTALAAPAIEGTPASPSATQSPMTWLLEADALQQLDAIDDSFVDTQPAAQATEMMTESTQDAQVAPAGLPATAAPAPAPEAADVAVTQTVQAPGSLASNSITSPEPTRVQADGTVQGNSVGGGEQEDDTSNEATPAETLSPDAPAIARFAAAFDNPEGLPVVAVVLIDDGALTDGPAQVLQSGIVATVAVDALMQDATLWSEAYREAGAEVAMQVPLPDRATPGDVEVAFAAALEILPEAGMLFSDGTGVLRNDRLAAAQVMQILASEGRGLVTIQQGLGSLVRAAERAEVPVATVSRDVDGAGESNSAILRALDQAAFRARQSGGTVVVARLKPRTLDVLSIWARDAAGDGILMGPVSALIVDRSDFLVETPDEAAQEAADEGGSGLPRISQ